MSKFYTAGIAALFAAVAVAATTVPAAAKHHHHHGHHHGHGGFDWGFGGIVVDLGGYDEPNPIYCVGKHGKLYICGWN